ncbi:hypothetical protein VKT23_001091 [Stygiomarasmius scandens]|uniref:Uncharacterized protein n=1 Tax=Marasmiellus scandens TaxID=2682957 RepID=A0ABR1K749_9AGAR
MGSPFEQFGCLDELIQVIYHKFDRFVLLSNVTDDEWTVHVGLSGEQGRWWQGSWKDTDVFKAIGSKSSHQLQEAFAQKLADCIIQGNVFISNCNDSAAQMKLTLSPPGKEPAHLPLTEMSAAAAASWSTSVFLDIAMRAQSRKNQLHGSEVATSSSIVPSSSFRGTDGVSDSTSVKESESSNVPESRLSNEATEKNVKRKKIEPPAAQSRSQPKPRKGASLANPNKKARRYQAQEFESDEE